MESFNSKDSSSSLRNSSLSFPDPFRFYATFFMNSFLVFLRLFLIHEKWMSKHISLMKNRPTMSSTLAHLQIDLDWNSWEVGEWDYPSSDHTKFLFLYLSLSLFFFTTQNFSRKLFLPPTYMCLDFEHTTATKHWIDISQSSSKCPLYHRAKRTLLGGRWRHFLGFFIAAQIYWTG